MVVVVTLTLFGFGQGQAKAAPVGASRAAEVGGNIVANTTWTKANSPYLVTSNVNVVSDITLTIEPGVEVIVATLTHFNVDGALVANGTQQEPILFRGSTQEAGWWYGIEVSGSQEKPASVIFNYVTVKHAGYDFELLPSDGALDIQNANATIRNSTFQDNGNNGLVSDLYRPLLLENSTFNNNGLSAILFEGGTHDPQLSNLQAQGNGTAKDRPNYDPEYQGFDAVVYDAMHWPAGDHTLEVMGLPYVLTHGFNVEPAGKLIIAPGVKISVQNALSIDGELSAVGTAASPHSHHRHQSGAGRLVGADNHW